jgi:hypothetical protein
VRLRCMEGERSVSLGRDHGGVRTGGTLMVPRGTTPGRHRWNESRPRLAILGEHGHIGRAAAEGR